MQAEQRVQRVNLHLALGGSFEPRPRRQPYASRAQPPGSTSRASAIVPTSPALGRRARYIVCDGNAIAVPARSTDVGHAEQQLLLDLEELVPVARAT